MTTMSAAPDLIVFDEGLPGFEAVRRYVLVSSPDLDPFTLVQGTGVGAPSFLAIEPRLVDPDYASPLAESDLVRLGADNKTPLQWLVLITMGAGGSATVN